MTFSRSLGYKNHDEEKSSRLSGGGFRGVVPDLARPRGQRLTASRNLALADKMVVRQEKTLISNGRNYGFGMQTLNNFEEKIFIIENDGQTFLYLPPPPEASRPNSYCSVATAHPARFGWIE